MRAALTALTSVVLTLTLAAPAVAARTGEGIAGETNDKVVTWASLGVVAFFTIFVILASLAQGRLERRKEEQKAARAAQRVGW